MGLGGAGCPAYAVAPGATAQKDDLVARCGALAAHVTRGRGAHDGAYLQALGGVAGVVELEDLSRGEADLVAVGGVALGGRAHELALGELASHGLAHRHEWVSRSGHAHGLIDIGAARERVANGSPDAGRRTAKGLDLGGVVVRLVLKEEEPVLVPAVYIDRDPHRAGVYLVRLIEVREDALGLEPAGTDGSHVHEADGSLCAPKVTTHREVLLEGALDHGIVDAHVRELGAEGRVPAVVRPVGVDHPDLGDRGHAPLVPKVLLAEAEVSEAHGEAALSNESLQPLLVEVVEAIEQLDVGGCGVGRLERGALVERGPSGFDGIDDVGLDSGHVGV